MEDALVWILNRLTPRPAPKREPEDETSAIPIGWVTATPGNSLPCSERLLGEELDRHVYVLGRSGSGKSRFTELVMRWHIRQRQGFCLVDPHGELCDALLAFAYREHHYGRLSDVDLLRLALIEPFRDDNALSLNPLDAGGGPIYPHVGELIGIFRRLWLSSWGPRLEEILRNTLLALALSGETLVEVPRFLTDEPYRRSVLIRIDDQAVKSYWADRFDRMSDAMKLTVVEPVLNKVNAIQADPQVRTLLGARANVLNLRRLMDSGGQLLLNCSRGQLRDAGAILGSFITAQIQSAALSRADSPAADRRPFTLLVDEFQTFRSEGFETILSEARKYRLRLVVCHQHLAQLDPSLQSAILGNVAIRVVFAVSAADAGSVLKNLDGVTLTPTELTGLPIRHALVWRQGKGGRVVEILPVETPEIGREALLAFATRLRRQVSSYAVVPATTHSRASHASVRELPTSVITTVHPKTPALAARIQEALDD